MMTYSNRHPSIWTSTASSPMFSALEGNVAVDVAIIGGGITGITAAYLLKQAGKTVAVLEANEIGSGTTGFTTAYLTEAVDARYEAVINKFGLEAAKLVARSNRAAIDKVQAIVQAENIDCEFERVPYYFYSETEEDIPYLQKEANAAKQAGLNVFLTADVPLPFPVKQGLLFPDQAQFHALKYIYHLARQLPDEGSHVFTHTRVLRLEDGARCKVETAQGTVIAQSVILATHTPIYHNILQQKLLPQRSYVLGIRLNDQRVPEGIFEDTVDPYFYTRRAYDTQGEILLVGGKDHTTGQQRETEKQFEQLEEYAHKRYAIESIPYRWSAQYYDPADELPFIGRSPFASNMYVGTGYSGKGMTGGTLAAMILSDLISGNDNPWADVYSPKRLKLLASARQLIGHGLEATRNFVGARIKADATELNAVKPGQGRHVRVEGKQLAVYREESGKLHVLSAICTHQGCVVQWNDSEKSWDCPCHGSRFNFEGDVLEGPAVKGLERKEV